MKQRLADFSGDRFFLSNFYLCDIYILGQKFISVEQYYQYKKCMNKRDENRVLDTKTSAEAKNIGHIIHIRPDWDLIKDGVMFVALYAKFKQNLELRQKLLDTNDDILEEGNTWGDTYWGVDYYTRVGQNKLGKMLMDIRAEFKNKKIIKDKKYLDNI